MISEQGRGQRIGQETFGLFLIGINYDFGDTVVALDILHEVAVAHLFCDYIGIEIENTGQKEEYYGVHPPQAEFERPVFLSVGFIYWRECHNVLSCISLSQEFL